jgi:hypothetical protein
MNISDDFNGSPDSHWTQVTTGGAYLQTSKSILRFGYDSATPERYSDSQIDDYTMLSKADYLWKPPLRMTVRARFSHPTANENSTEKTKGILRGTAGFGFWNKPFTMQGNWFTFPEAVWFFYSAPPSNMALVPGVPGWGWKAQVIHTTAGSAAANAVPTFANAVYGRVQSKVQPKGHAMQRLTGAHEALVAEDITEWHTYTLEWRENSSLFWVDGNLLLEAPKAPTKPLGLVVWLDNEYAVVTPKGELRFGKTTAGKQWMDVDSISIEHL